MNIVWIEDFGGELLAPDESTVDRFFKSLDLKLGHPGWLGNSSLKKQPEKLEARCRQYGSRHVISLFTKYWLLWDWAHTENGLLDADLFLIDLNLDDAFDNERPPPLELAGDVRRAGFKLFHCLTLEHAFPSSRIAFLTANASDIEEFNTFARNHHLPELTCFSKDHEGLQQLSSWLLSHSEDPAVDLRRGMLDGLTITEEVGIINSPKVKGQLDSAQTALIKDTVMALMHDSRLISNHPHLIAFALAQPWDSIDWSDISDQPLKTWMKHCRNALAHRHFVEKLTPNQLALVVLVSLGAMAGTESCEHAIDLLHRIAARDEQGNSTPSRLQQEIVESLKGDLRIIETNNGGVTEFKRSVEEKHRAKETDGVLRLAAFALKNGVYLPRPPFAYFAADIWASSQNPRAVSRRRQDGSFFWDCIADASKRLF